MENFSKSKSRLRAPCDIRDSVRYCAERRRQALCDIRDSQRAVVRAGIPIRMEPERGVDGVVGLVPSLCGLLRARAQYMVWDIRNREGFRACRARVRLFTTAGPRPLGFGIAPGSRALGRGPRD